MDEDQIDAEEGISLRWARFSLNKCVHSSISTNRQIAGADAILLNKTDVAEKDAAHRLETRIRAVNPSATLHRTVMAQIDLKYVVGLDAYSAKPPLLSNGGDIEPPNHIHDENCNHDHERAKFRHDGITSMQVKCGPLSPEQVRRLDEWIRSVLWDGQLPFDSSNPRRIHQVEVLRCKGAFSTADGEQHVLQGVRSMYEMSPIVGKRDMGVPDEGKLVFIGKGLDEEARASLLKVIS